MSPTAHIVPAAMRCSPRVCDLSPASSVLEVPSRMSFILIALSRKKIPRALLVPFARFDGVYDRMFA